MTEPTYADGLVEGRLVTLEAASGKYEEEIHGLRSDITGMGESLRKEMRHYLEPIYNQLMGNGQPGLIKRFENIATTVKLNWGVTLLMLAAIIGLALRAFTII